MAEMPKATKNRVLIYRAMREPYTLRGVRTVQGEVCANLLSKNRKAALSYSTGKTQEKPVKFKSQNYQVQITRSTVYRREADLQARYLKSDVGVQVM